MRGERKKETLKTRDLWSFLLLNPFLPPLSTLFFISNNFFPPSLFTVPVALDFLLFLSIRRPSSEAGRGGGGGRSGARGCCWRCC